VGRLGLGVEEEGGDSVCVRLRRRRRRMTSMWRADWPTWLTGKIAGGCVQEKGGGGGKPTCDSCVNEDCMSFSGRKERPGGGLTLCGLRGDLYVEDV